MTGSTVPPLIFFRIDSGADSCVPCGRSWHSFTPVNHKDIFLYGGYSQDNSPLSDCWILDCETYRWTRQTGCYDKPRLWHTGCCTDDGDILIFGGCSNDILSDEEPIVRI